MPLDFSERVFALRVEVASVKNVAAFAVLILGARTGKENYLARTGDRYGLREAAFRPLTVIVIFFSNV